MQVQYEGAHSVLIKPHGATDEYLVDLWEKWGLVPSSCPVISPPEVKTNFVEVYGANDVVDLTEFPRGFPIYGRRNGPLEFYVDGSSPDYDWAAVCTAVQQYIHGKKFDLILKDDLAYFYTGRLEVNTWKCDKHWSTVSIDYDLAAYKLTRQSMLEPWKWNPFNFDRDIIPDVAKSNFEHIAVSDTKTSKTFSAIFLGNMPFTPKFILDSGQLGNYAMTIEYRNNIPDGVEPDQEISKYPYKSVKIAFTNGNTIVDNPAVMFAATASNTNCQIRFETTKVQVIDDNPSSPFNFSIDFHQGRL